MTRESPVGHGLREASRSRSGTPWSVGLLWTNDQPVAETSDNTTLTTDIHATRGIQTWDPSWDRLWVGQFCKYSGDEIKESARGRAVCGQSVNQSVSQSGSFRLVNVPCIIIRHFVGGTCVHTYVRMHICLYVCMYVCMYVCICVCVCMYVLF